ncbi:MAG: adenine phosphoribosyltransferase [Ruminococcus sp.]|nr:adenine phosphoribosyltransferase [Candidatus Copronaster equi]
MSETYKMTIAGCERELPLCPINEKVSIGAFIIFGDVELTINAAKELIEKCPEFDYIITPEAKSIPLAYEMSRQSGKPYIVCRKKEKLYMKNPISVSVKSITTSTTQTVYFDQTDADKITNKRVLIIDDVISTGESLAAVEKLLEKCDTNIVGRAAILAEGDAADRKDIIFLEKLPLFVK